ncbi:M20 family metallopeptidase [Nocardia alni]|uniref:M20 family metallopeptidase n=1 Tax=Nocardia alni TaxID=2815723 RepID=UPI0020B43EC0|nr:M20 family metallopeptidase [Nocardia alni]
MKGAADLLPVMLERLETLVNCESPSRSLKHLRACADLLHPWLSSAVARPVEVVAVGQHVHLLAPAVEPTVLLLGHFDTVWPAGTTAEWPFSIQDRIASGPGVFDMKAGIVQLIAALDLLEDTNHVSVLLTSDEEIGSETSRALIEEQAKLAGAVLVCEPSADGGAVKIGRKGIANYRVTVHGRAAHAGLEPHLGVNAGIELAHQVLSIAGLAFGDTTVTPTVLAAGTTVNTVPEQAQCDVDVRSWTKTELETVDRAMFALSPRLPGAEVVVTGGIDRPPFEEHAARALFAEAETAAKKVGLELDAVKSGGGSDGNLTAAVGVATLDGLGAVGGHPHGRSEHVDVSTMPERTALLAALLAQLGDGHSPRP